MQYEYYCKILYMYSWKCLRTKYFAKCSKDVGLWNKSWLLLTNEFIIVHCSNQNNNSTIIIYYNNLML